MLLTQEKKSSQRGVKENARQARVEVGHTLCTVMPLKDFSCSWQTNISLRFKAACQKHCGGRRTVESSTGGGLAELPSARCLLLHGASRHSTP